MSIRLDWTPNSRDRAGNHPTTAIPAPGSREGGLPAWVMAILAFILTLITITAVLVVWRLNETDRYLESLLRSTIDSEFTALRIGDRDGFRALQRSATLDWETYQLRVFDAFQAGKSNGTINITGVVRDLTTQGTRARALVEWAENGTTYQQAWFYWRYEDGWRHVPPDTTFWGTAQELRGQNVTVRYQDMDSRLAREMGIRVEGWIASACGPILQCGDLPHVTLSLTPDPYTPKGWGSDANMWVLTLESPYITGTRADQPFSGALLENTANYLAQRLIEASLGVNRDAFRPGTEADAVVMAVQTWLVGQFLGIDTGAVAIGEYAARYGRAGVGVLLKRLTPASTVQDVLLTPP
jgi:hypothetical protein